MRGDTIRQREAEALAYLREQLAARAPAGLRLAGEFDETPLEGEGRTWLFSFQPGGADAAPSAGATALTRHYVAVGETAPNYFPAYGLDADEAYSFHIGTRFMLVMGVQKVDASLELPHVRPALREFINHYASGAILHDEQLAGLFRCEDDYFAVFRLRLNQQDVYCFAADCPPGFCTMTNHPPQAALRLHLGRVIRAEAREAAARQDGSGEAP